MRRGGHGGIDSIGLASHELEGRLPVELTYFRASSLEIEAWRL